MVVRFHSGKGVMKVGGSTSLFAGVEVQSGDNERNEATKAENPGGVLHPGLLETDHPGGPYLEPGPFGFFQFHFPMAWIN